MQFYFGAKDDIRLLASNKPNSWFHYEGSEYLLGRICSVYGSKAPHRFIIDLSNNAEDTIDCVGLLLFTNNQLKEIINLVCNFAVFLCQQQILVDQKGYH